jgi:hypothetical protein
MMIGITCPTNRIITLALINHRVVGVSCEPDSCLTHQSDRGCEKKGDEVTTTEKVNLSHPVIASCMKVKPDSLLSARLLVIITWIRSQKFTV